MTAAFEFIAVPTPLGTLLVTASPTALAAAHFADQAFVPAAFAAARPARAGGQGLLRRAAAGLDAYFAGAGLPANLPLAPQGTAFQERVWSALAAIAPGRTRTYREVAEAVATIRAARATGAAIGRNPLAVFIPCHRVVGSDGSLTGYAGGIHRKRALLDLERGGAPGRIVPDAVAA